MISKMAVIAEWRIMLVLCGQSLYFVDVVRTKQSTAMLGDKVEVPHSKGTTLFSWCVNFGMALHWARCWFFIVARCDDISGVAVVAQRL